MIVIDKEKKTAVYLPIFLCISEFLWDADENNITIENKRQNARIIVIPKFISWRNKEDFETVMNLYNLSIIDFPMILAALSSAINKLPSTQSAILMEDFSKLVWKEMVKIHEESNGTYSTDLLNAYKSQDGSPKK